MQKYVYLFLLVLAALLISCGSQKDEIIIENETPESVLQKAQVALEQNDYDRAIELSQLMINYYPTSDLHVDAQLLTADAYGGKEKFEQQLDLILRILRENTIPEKVPEIYIQLAEFYEHAAKWNPGNLTSDSLDIQKAANYYRKAVFYPNSNDNVSKAAALYRVGLMYAKLNDLETAKRAYEQVSAFYPETAHSKMAQMKLKNPADTSELDPAMFAETATVATAPAETAEEKPTTEFQDLTAPVETEKSESDIQGLLTPQAEDSLQIDDGFSPTEPDTTVQDN